MTPFIKLYLTIGEIPASSLAERDLKKSLEIFRKLHFNIKRGLALICVGCICDSFEEMFSHRHNLDNKFEILKSFL